MTRKICLSNERATARIRNIMLLMMLVFFVPAFAFTNLFYTLRDSDVPQLQDHYRVLNDIQKHHQKISILVPQAYVISRYGFLFKQVQPEFEKTARHYAIPLMPLVTNSQFNAKNTDHFLRDKTAQRHAIHILTTLCQQKRYAGFQIDFEHIPEYDRNAFTRFYQNTAHALHANHCKISVAIVPQRHQIAPTTLLYHRHLHWTGAYNQDALGKVSDWVILMTYNQHGPGTTPGPNASNPLDAEAVQYALKHIPRKKILLGIPTDSNYWTMGSRSAGGAIAARALGISYQQVLLLQKMHHLKWKWDNFAKMHYAVFPYQDFYHYLFVEDAKSFSEKVKLAKRYHLGGIAVFRLGTEDPGIWLG